MGADPGNAGRAAGNGEEFRRSLHEMLESRGHRSDDDLATLIREHGRERLERGRRVELADYLDAIRGLESRRAPLDAAIDIALRARAGTARPDDGAVESLIREHPDLELPIREAAVLAHALWSTGDLGAAPSPEAVRELPEDFGPTLDDGRARYTLTRRLGGGAAGEVYLAEDRRLSDDDRPALVAIKILRTGRRDAFARRRFVEEAAKARRLDHAGVVRVFDRAESASGEDFIVYEFIAGGDLHRWAERRGGRVPVREAVRLAARIARAVQAAHNAGLVHLDLKPGNVLMTHDGEPKVADFDLARRRKGGGWETGDGAPLGTYAFMSPEQYLGEPDAAAPPADVYALAGILYWLLGAQLPNGDRVDEIGTRHHDRRAPDLEPVARRPGVDRDLVAIVRRSLDPEPAARHDSAGSLADDLEAWLAREPIRWTRPGPMRVLSLFARRRPAIFALALIALAALLATVIALDSARRAQARARSAQYEAHARDVEARIARVQRDAEIEYKAKLRDDVTRFIGSLTEAGEAGLAGEALASLWVLEWIHGPTILAQHEALPELWARRVEILRDLYQQRRAEAGPDALQVLQMQTLLGFWLVRRDDFEEAEPLLEDNLTRWRTLLDDDDPWLEEVRLIRDAAAANRLHALAQDAQPTEAQLEEARAIVAQMEALDPRLAQRDDGAQLRLLLWDTVATLQGPRLLDDPDARVDAWNRADALDISGVEPRNTGERAR